MARYHVWIRLDVLRNHGETSAGSTLFARRTTCHRLQVDFASVKYPRIEKNPWVTSTPLVTKKTKEVETDSI